MNPPWGNLLPPFLRRRLEGRETLLKVARNAGWLDGEKILRIGISLFVGVWVARYLGPEQYGVFSYLWAFVIAHDLSSGIPLSDESCNAVYHSHVLEHLRREDGLQFLQECYRVLARIGEEARSLVASLKQQGAGKAVLKHKILRYTLQMGQKPLLAQGVTLLTMLYQRFAPRLLLGKKAAQALDIGLFRLGGEVHQWMYDRFSLEQTLRNAGFADPVRQTAWESAVPNWSDFSLDTLPDGTIRKPDSLFMEATRP